jgi:tRNA-specific 2-thiouridylase
MAREGAEGASLGAGRGRRIVVGLSGGVDSSVALLLLKRQGWSPVGVSLLFPSWENECNQKRENACCTSESLGNARKVCLSLGVPHHVYDCQDSFSKEVMDYFTSELACGRTPNPCSICNWKVKFRKLLEWADKHKIRHVATGHYAKLMPGRGRTIRLVRPKDRKKDQTYGLCLLPRKWLPRIIFPLAPYSKQEAYGFAIKAGFEFYRKLPQSQDLCFVSGGQMRRFLLEKIGEKRGPIIEQETGKELGRHDGLFHFTIGQRRGLRFPHMHFVLGFDAARNAVFVTKNRGKLLRKGMAVGNLNYVSCAPLSRKTKAFIQIHPHQAEIAATVVPKGKKGLEVLLSAPLEGIAPGQICAIYKKGACLGGGTIEKAL